MGLILCATSVGSAAQPASATGGFRRAIEAAKAPREVFAVAGDGTATVQWAAPVTSGGSSIAAYVIAPYLGTRAHKRQVFHTTRTTAVVTGLTNGVSFSFRVAAENAAGVGAWSGVSDVVTIGAPAAPSAARVSMAGPGSLSVAFTAPADNGAAITTYVTACTPSNGGTTRTGTGAASPLTVRGLRTATNYSCTVRATNSRGTGPASAPSMSTLISPTGVRVTPGVGTATIAWTPDQSSGVTYTVTSSPTAKSCTVIDTTSCTVPVTDSTPWRFSVTASDLSGSSPPSPLTPVVRHRLILVVAGQSNAVGTESYAFDPITFTDYFTAPYTNEADSASSITWMPSSHSGLLPAPENGPVNLDTAQMLDTATPVQVFGPEIGLARTIWTGTRLPVTIVKAAVGSTSLALDWDPATPDGLYAQMVAHVIATMSADADAGQLDTIGAVYWYQGEDDAANSDWYPKYESNLADFITHLRADLPLNAKTPIVLAKESQAATIAYRQATGDCPFGNCAALQVGDAAVRAADDWAAANLPHVVEVDTLSLPRVAPLLIHLSNIGELTLGSELASATEHLFP